MATQIGPTPPAGYHPYGKLSETWERGVFLGLNVTLPFVVLSAYRAFDCGWPIHQGVSALPWIAYGAVQIASKLPVSFTYTPRGWEAILDLGCFAASILAVFAFALNLGEIVNAFWWRAGLVVAILGVAAFWTSARTLMDDGSPIPWSRELYARSVGTLVNSPMLFALAVLAYGSMKS